MHATPEEAQMISALESRVNVETSPVDNLLRLAQLYICPQHSIERAVELLQAVLRRDPDNMWAKYWLAYRNLRYATTKGAVLEARRLLEHCPEQAGALYQLLCPVREELGDLSDEERVALLEESVRLEPNWTGNREWLALAYEKVGRIEDAVRQLETALQNMLPEADPSWDPVKSTFEAEVTGRTGVYSREEIPKILVRLRKAQQARGAGRLRIWQALARHVGLWL